MQEALFPCSLQPEEAERQLEKNAAESDAADVLRCDKREPGKLLAPAASPERTGAGSSSGSA